MDIRVAHMTYFYKNKEKLIRDIKEERLIKQTRIILFCILHIIPPEKLNSFFFQTFAQFNPGIIVVGFCFSMKSDVFWLLRECGISAIMFLTHDLKTITNNPLAELDPIQKELVDEIGIIFII